MGIRAFKFTNLDAALAQSYDNAPKCFKCVRLQDVSNTSDFTSRTYADGFDVHAVTSNRGCVNCPDDDTNATHCSCQAEACDDLDTDIVRLPHCHTIKINYTACNLPDRTPKIWRRSLVSIYDQGVPFIYRTDRTGGWCRRGSYYRDGSGYKSQDRYVVVRPPASGTFAVYAWWTGGDDRASAVPYEIWTTGGLVRWWSSHRNGRNKWNRVGGHNYDFRKRDDDDESEDEDRRQGCFIRTRGTSGYVVFDSIRYCKRIPVPEPNEASPFGSVGSGGAAGIAVAAVAIAAAGTLLVRRARVNRRLAQLGPSRSPSTPDDVVVTPELASAEMVPTTASLTDVRRYYNILDAQISRTRLGASSSGSIGAQEAAATPTAVDADVSRGDLRAPLSSIQKTYTDMNELENVLELE